MEKIQGLENIDKVDEFIKLTEQALKDEEKYKIILESMMEIGLMSIIPMNTIDKSIELAKDGGRKRSLEIIKKNEEKKTLLN